MALYQELGFISHPFLKTNADEEESLQEYFVPPPYFDAIVGDSTNPSASIVLAPRGAGKTAQRRMVESFANEAKFLAVTYDRFEFGSGEKVENLTLNYHLRNIITRVLVSYLSYLSEYPDLIRKLTKEQKEQLSLFVQTYLGEMNGSDIQELMRELKGLPEKAKDFWNKHVGVFEPVVNFILSNYDLDPIDLPNAAQEEKRLSETYKYQLEGLYGLVKTIGFNSIYLLLDRPDETEQTGNDAEKTYLLIRPLLRDLELLGLNGYGFKFFLWDKIETFFRDDARPDRIQQYRLQWTRQSLKIVLSRRLAAHSEGKINSFSMLMENDEDVDDAICLMANGSPRNMIRLCEKVFALHGNRSVVKEKIDYLVFDQATVSFSEQLAQENYDDSLVKEIQRVGKELFTTNYVANDILKISGNGARNKITGWTKAGLVSQVGTVVVPPATRPTHFYCVVDPFIVRLMHRSQPFKDFLKDRWLPCINCETDNLIDIELYPVDNDAVCRHCGRELL